MITADFERRAHSRACGILPLRDENLAIFLRVENNNNIFFAQIL